MGHGTMYFGNFCFLVDVSLSHKNELETTNELKLIKSSFDLIWKFENFVKSNVLLQFELWVYNCCALIL